MERNWKIGYCINCDARDLYDLGCDRTYTDSTGTERIERDSMFKSLRRGDTLILLSRSHMGKGKEIPRLIALAQSLGVTVEVKDATPSRPAPQKPGPRSEIQPTPSQWKRLRACWRGPQKRAVALRQAVEIMHGQNVSQHWLNRNIGPRGAIKKEQSK